MPFVYSFHATAGPAHAPFSDNEIHGPGGKLVQQGEQTSVYVCKSCVCVCVCVRARVRICMLSALLWHAHAFYLSLL